jgi:histidinol-phosphate aminotransferase
VNGRGSRRRPTPRLSRVTREPLLPLRPELRGIEPYGAPQLDVPALLNVNENPYAPSPAVVAEIAARVAAAASGLNRYPDRDFPQLREALAGYLTRESGVAVAVDQVWAANGSNEVMLHLLQAFGGPGRTALSFAPTYSMYPEYARDTHTRWVAGKRETDFTIDLDHALETIAAHQPSVILLTSPNNPTGTSLSLELVEAVCEAALRVDVDGAPAVVVVDEAYGEFRRAGVPSALGLLERFTNLAVSRTMSKAFALAGARLGYLAAHPRLVDALRVVRLPYHLSGVTQATALAALAHADELLAQVDALRSERDATVTWLQQQTVDGAPLLVAESDANFVLFGTFADRHAVWQGLLDRGVLIRETGPDGWLRVSIGTPQEMAAFRAALVEVAL